MNFFRPLMVMAPCAIGLRIVRPLVICGAIVAAAPGHVAGAKLCMVSLSHPFPSLPPFAEDKQGGRASSPAGGRGDRVCSHYSKRGVSQSTGDNLSRLPPRRRCKEQEKVRKEGRKEESKGCSLRLSYSLSLGVTWTQERVRSVSECDDALPLSPSTL